MCGGGEGEKDREVSISTPRHSIVSRILVLTDELSVFCARIAGRIITWWLNCPLSVGQLSRAVAGNFFSIEANETSAPRTEVRVCGDEAASPLPTS